MAVKRTARKRETDCSQLDPAVSEFLHELAHPLKKVVEAIRRIILGISPEIHEGIKWNAPSFRTTEYFATVNLHGKEGKEHVMLILHRGAKARDNSMKGLKIADPTGILKWLAKDRCLVTFVDGKDLDSKRPALEAIIRQWIQDL